MSYSDGICEVCGNYVQAQVRYFSMIPFVDGRFYQLVCWTCANVPKIVPVNDEPFIRPGGGDGVTPGLISSVEDMQEDGWSREDARAAIKVVANKIKQMPISLTKNFGNVYINEK